MAALWAQFMVVEELENAEQQHQSRLFRRRLRDAQDPFALPDEEFVRHFRLNREAGHYVFATAEPHMQESGYTSRIPKLLRVLAALNFFASGSYQRSVGSNLVACCSQAVVSRSIKEVTTIMVRHFLRLWVRFPRNEAEKLAIKVGFQRRHRMAHIVGVVDGTHIAIVTPADNEHIYVNRKGYHSLNCQIICDAQLRITNIVARWPGSTHDSYIWRRSRIGQTLEANYVDGDHTTILIGDSGYACLPWLLVPVARPATPAEVRFNARFKRCRSTIEQCIGLLKGRFRCLLKDRTLHYAPGTAANIVITCAILHNIALHYRVDDPVPQWDALDLEVPPPAPAAAPDAVYRQLGQARRHQYINRYFQ